MSDILQSSTLQILSAISNWMLLVFPLHNLQIFAYVIPVSCDNQLRVLPCCSNTLSINTFICYPPDISYAIYINKNIKKLQYTVDNIYRIRYNKHIKYKRTGKLWFKIHILETEGGDNMITDIKRGDIIMANLKGEGSEQKGCRPVLIMQNNVGNKYSPTTIIVPITSKIRKLNMPTHKIIKVSEATGLRCDSMAECEQLTTIDKRKLSNKVGRVESDSLMKDIAVACACAIAL
jgi:mRNA interferase MazF